MRALLISFTLLLSSVFCFAQKGILEGRITDAKSGVSVPSITIAVENENITKVADVDGRYTLNLEVGKKYSLKVSGVGYKTKVVDEVIVEAGKITSLDITLDAANKTEEGVVVRSSARKESTASLITFQKNTSVVAQVVSAEAIRRSPDKNTGEILKRVPGLSIQEGKFVIVRGLADRYNQAMLNGILLSSTEPDRKTFSFDIFPASVIDNIIINKAFIPELPGEWAGGLIQVNTKDVPSKNFLNVQVGTGFNTNVIGKDFYSQSTTSSIDFLGLDNNVRTLPDNFPRKEIFKNTSTTSTDDRLNLAKQIATDWSINKTSVIPNIALQVNGGLSTKVLNKKIGAVLALTYNKNLRNNYYNNSLFSVDLNNNAAPKFIYSTDKYAKDILWGGIANFSVQLNNSNKISVKNLFNVTATEYVALRTGQDLRQGTKDDIRARELGFRSNIFYTTQIAGEHNLTKLKTKINWFGSFNILSQSIPQQRRLVYIKNEGASVYEPLLSTSQSQESGSIFYSDLSDYIYTAGGDVAKTFQLFGNKQTIKAGYLFQVKDRLFDSRPFTLKLNDPSLKNLNEDALFNSNNFTATTNYTLGKISIEEFIGSRYRYIANSILNAGYIQLDNNFSDKWRAVWGLRIEDFDQVIGSLKQSDDRHTYSKVTDFLPALNLTYKLNPKTNIRFSASQTVVRPEFRELSSFGFYDFELGSSVLGNKNLVRTKITNLDLRYELYPRAGELFTLGVFYKNFKSPIELFLNETSFNYIDNEPLSANSYGVELEVRKKLDFSETFKNSTLTSNLAYIYNRVKFENSVLDRQMQGQSPYVINASIQYDLEKHGLATTLLFNQIGRRIAFVGNEQNPATYEAPRPLLDFQISKKVNKNKGEVKLNVSDIINQRANFYQDLDTDGKYTKKSKDALNISRKFGTTFSISFAYTIK